MRIFLASLLFSGVLAGCATTKLTDSYLQSGNYAEAYSMTVLYPSWWKERPSVIQQAMNETGGAKGDKFYRSLLTQLRNFREDTTSGYRKTIEVWEGAAKDGLISVSQHQALRKELTSIIEDSAVTKPVILEDEKIKNFMVAEGANPLSRAEKNLGALIKSGEPSVEKYLGFYKFFDGKSDSLKQLTATHLKSAVEKDLAPGSSKKTFKDLIPSLEYVELSKDRSLDAKFQEKLLVTSLSRENLQRLESSFPLFAKEQIQRRVVKIDVKTNGDEFVAGEISDALQKINEWIAIDHESPRKLNLNRLRISEQRGNSSSMTETVANPDFGTLLFIPRNASVLFDYTSTDYGLQWNFSAQDSLTRKQKSISGNKRFRKIECRNIRYQNVFGGTGAIGNYPNSQVQAFCTQSASVDFDAERAKTIDEIANVINEELYVPAK